VNVVYAILLEADFKHRCCVLATRFYGATVRTVVSIGETIRLQAQRFHTSLVKKILLWIGALLLFRCLWPTYSIVIASTQVDSPASSSWTHTNIENFYPGQSSVVTAEDYPVYFACSLLTLPFSFFQWGITYYRDRPWGFEKLLHLSPVLEITTMSMSIHPLQPFPCLKNIDGVVYLIETVGFYACTTKLFLLPVETTPPFILSVQS
jgi:hypothetical protein